MSRCNVCDNNVGKKYYYNRIYKTSTNNHIKYVWLCDRCYDDYQRKKEAENE